jgi:hypothetical protein
MIVAAAGEAKGEREVPSAIDPLAPSQIPSQMMGAAVQSLSCLGLKRLRDIDALLKSQEIAWRGAALMQAACHGFVQVTMQEQFADVRTRLTCRSLESLWRLERDLTEIFWRRTALRAAVLGRMLIEAMEDASVPLWRRVAAAAEVRCCHRP